MDFKVGDYVRIIGGQNDQFVGVVRWVGVFFDLPLVMVDMFGLPIYAPPDSLAHVQVVNGEDTQPMNLESVLED